MQDCGIKDNKKIGGLIIAYHFDIHTMDTLINAFKNK